MAIGDFILLINHKDKASGHFKYSRKKEQQQNQINLITKLIMSFVAVMNFYSMNVCCYFSMNYCFDDATRTIPYQVTLSFQIFYQQLLMSQLSMQECSSWEDSLTLGIVSWDSWIFYSCRLFQEISIQIHQLALLLTTNWFSVWCWFLIFRLY